MLALEGRPVLFRELAARLRVTPQFLGPLLKRHAETFVRDYDAAGVPYGQYLVSLRDEARGPSET